MNVDPTLFLPELFQIALILCLFGRSIFGRTPSADHVDGTGWLPFASAIGIVAAGLGLSAQGLVLWEAYRLDGLSQFFKFAVALGFFFAVLNAQKQPTLAMEQRSDYFLLLSLSALGLMCLASSVELMTIYLSLELSSYSLYALIPLRAKNPKASEAGVKYILFGAAATAVSLYGLSYILASQHTSYLAALVQKPWNMAEAPMGLLGVSLFMAGFFYKLALFPFHFWAPDVYEGTSNETAAYAATLPKLGAVVILIRLSATLVPGLSATTILAVFGALSMTFGNLAALSQQDIKRLLGYSSVSHAGYVTLGLVSGLPQGLAAAGFYSLVYVLMNLTCFWVICRLSVNGENVTLNDLNGLYKNAPFLAFVLAVGAFSLVGLPPTAGFMGKLFLLSSAWNRGYNWLVITAAVNTAIAIYYYLNIVRHAYTLEREASASVMNTQTGFDMIWGGVLAFLVLALGMVPSAVFEWAEAAGKQLMP